MYTSLLLFALGGLTPSAVADRVAWQTDYAVARKQAEVEKKPLAVVIGSGANGWGKLSNVGKLESDVQQVLASQYVSLYVDSSTEDGQRLAEAFKVQGGLGLVISDRGGEVQAFRHSGDLTSASLQTYLQRFADPNLVVRRTETNPGENPTTTYYEPGAVVPGYCRH